MQNRDQGAPVSVLFSPLGKTDWIGLDAADEGSVLHIIRSYPDISKVVLYLSANMVERNQTDSFSSYIDYVRQDIKVEVIEHPELVDVHLFDVFYHDFSLCLEKLSGEDPGATIYVNLTSGTPAMKSALMILSELTLFRVVPLQVADPTYADDQECRVKEVTTQNFRKLITIENIKELVKKYDYVAAFDLANTSVDLDDSAKDLIEAASLRLNLDGLRPAQVFAGTELAYRPDNQLAEYIYMLEVRLKKEAWADFIRAITPAITETALIVLRPDLHEIKYLQQTKGGAIEHKLDKEKITADKRLSKVLRNFIKGKEPHFLTNEALVGLLEEYGKNRDKSAKIKKLRKLELKSRNYLAHEIKRVDKKLIEKQGGITLEDALKYLFELNEMQSGLYTRISDYIISRL
jgi:hypothetical protein